MPYYRSVGDIPRKRHLVHRVDGAVVAEELMGEHGFSADSSLLYHRDSPSAVVAIEPVEAPEPAFTPNTPLSPHHLRPRSLDAPPDVDAVLGRRHLLGNDDVRLAWVRATSTSPLYRDAVGDELAYVQSGSAVLESVFGRLPLSAGDYVVIPASTTHRWVVDDAAELLLFEADGPRHRAGQVPAARPASCWRARRSPSATSEAPSPSRSSSTARTSRCWSAPAAG